MRLYEYEAKRLFRRYGIPVPESMVIDNNIWELENAVFPVVLKAQTLIGGRGKSGGIQFANNLDEAKKKIEELKKMKIKGYTVEKVLVEKKMEIAKEYYICATIDRIEHKPVLIVSLKGGVDIEEIAKTSPESIIKLYQEPGEKLAPHVGRDIAIEMGFKGENCIKVGNAINALYNDIFLGLDCKLVEINPFISTKDGKGYALDAKMDIDSDAIFRHPELSDYEVIVRHEVGELTEREKIAKAANIPYVDLDGYIGVFPGGAGFGIAAIDLIKHFGGEPANFMDSGGGPTPERMKTMLGLLMDNPKVVAIFGARFGGISRCDDWAKAVIQYIRENKPKKPMIMRMAGNMEEEARKMFEQARKETPELFSNVKIYAFDTPIEEVIKETVRVAKEILAKEKKVEVN